MLNRRSFMMTGAATLALRPLSATDFWDKKPPSEWTAAEIDRLLTKSPWTKEAATQYEQGRWQEDSPPTQYPGQYPGGGYPPNGGPTRGGGASIPGIPGIGGIGFPRRGGNGGGRPSGQPRGGTAFHGGVRWESAQPIRDALKSPLHEAFEGKYVIAVIGIPLLGEQARREDEPQDSLESLKGLTSLDIKGKSYIQPDEVRRQIGTGNTFLFGFPKGKLAIAKSDGEALFSTKLGHIQVKARFAPKEMLYHGELAV
ncbi:MAG TPA: hypothetical protein VKE70_35910 [Candidatus Solibacter sp.]|nr:hypothetical protein [Candidatus Solibacter sp.]